jgi:hypothetical protein
LSQIKKWNHGSLLVILWVPADDMLDLLPTIDLENITILESSSKELQTLLKFSGVKSK